ncbi:MAG: vanadium-dependent haloperoxidase [Williamsia sp.]|nr:vanadium-dependent haloperoxidase [Williamsia sp.]
MKIFLTILLLSLPFLFRGNDLPDWKSKTENAQYVHRAIKLITDVMVHDIYSPPVASRTYAYICVAGYEAALPGSSDYRTLAGRLHGLQPLPKAQPGKEYSYSLAAVQAIIGVGRTMVISEEKVTEFYTGITNEFRDAGVPSDVYDNSIAYGQQIAAHILAWAGKDNYKQTRTFSKYTPLNDAASWKPTPPAYFKAVEPHWNEIRTFLIDSADQFKPQPATPFSTDKESLFYKQALAVHDAGMSISEEQKEIANFWDCNPFKMNVNGHVMYASKKISPGGHWINITRLACQQAGAGLVKTLEAYACVALANADAFISCWDEKYRSVVIRPETYINQYIDDGWMPLIQTPPFPEHTSGHSVISNASAVVLTKLFGDPFPYADSTELEFGLPARRFSSFMQAAAEAAISRFYGGIHYMHAITTGTAEGRLIGEFVVKRLGLEP